MNLSITKCPQAKPWSLLAILFCLPFLLFSQSKLKEADVLDQLKRIPNLKLETQDYEDFKITAQYTDDYSGLTHVYLQQMHEGIDIANGSFGLHINASNIPVYWTNHFFAHKGERIRSVKPAISAEQAVKAAMIAAKLKTPKQLRVLEKTNTADRFTKFDKGEVVIHDIPARLIYEQKADGTFQLAWQVELYPLDEQNYWLTKVDATTGTILNCKDMVVHCSFGRKDHDHGAACSHAAEEVMLPGLPEAENNFETPTFAGTNFYRVYDGPIEAPTFGNRTLVGTAGDPVASPLGWHDDGILDYFITKGNNVYAYHDPGPLSTGIPAIGGLPGQQPLVFDFNLDLTQLPTLYRDAAITNLFYWNNLIHDMFYHYGFTEASGNFQWNNFGKGGEGLDAVLAEAQDGSGVDNANFLTLADGLPGRMQMFLWSTNIPLLDGDLDNGVILHEYGHGISTRLTGGPAATCLGGDEQGGEGWSDFFGYMMTMDPATVPGIFASGRGIGTYVLAESPNGLGIREAPYSTDFAINDYTYGDITNSEISVPHGVGFIWSTMLWEMTAKLVEAYGYDADVVGGSGGNNMAIRLVMEGLKLQPCSPTFVEQRDAILAADQLLHGGANQCLIWEAFAKRGLGFSASSGTNTLGDEVEAFDMPPSLCLPTVTIASEVDNEVEDGQALNILIKVTNTAATPISGVTVSNNLPAGTSFLSSSHTASLSGQTVTFSNLTIPANTVEEISIVALTNTGSTAEFLFFDDLENDPFNWTASPGIDQFVWSNTDAFSGSYAFHCANPNNLSNFYLTLNDPITVEQGTFLRFAHRYNTEQTFDGGLLEGSSDGTTWTDLGSAIVENGYNDFVPAANNPLINGFCFGGNSGKFIHSLVDLTEYVGTEMQVRYHFASDVLTAAEGWYIDDIQFVKDPHVIHNTASFSMAGGAISDSVEEQILVLGAGNSSMMGNARTQLNGAAVENAVVTNAPFFDVEVFPNPATTTVNIRVETNSDAVVAMNLRNVHGQLLKQINTSDRNLTLDVSALAPGVYTLQVQQDGEVKTQRLVIQ